MYIAFKIYLIEALKYERCISLIKLERILNRFNYANCLLMKFSVWTFLKKEDFSANAYLSSFSSLLSGSQVVTTIAKHWRKIRDENKGEVNAFFCFLFASCVSFSSDYITSMVPQHSPTLLWLISLQSNLIPAEPLALTGWLSLPDSGNRILLPLQWWLLPSSANPGDASVGFSFLWSLM